MQNSFRTLSSFSLVLIVVIGLIGCESPGSVGSGLSDSDPEVVTDTLLLNGLQSMQPNSYSGALEYFSAGQFNDPLFGDLFATGYLKPTQPASSDSVKSNASMLLRIILDGDSFYGSLADPQDYSIYEITDQWRDVALGINDSLGYDVNSPVGAFTINGEDSLDVPLSNQWVQKYRQFSDTTDSTYRYDFKGLAIVPDNSSKIIPLSGSNSRFVVQNVSADTFQVGLTEAGYSLKRGSNTSIPQNSIALHSTFESIINFADFGLSRVDIQAPGLSRAVLVLHQNNDAMQQSLQNEPAARRPQESTAYLHLADPMDLPENIDPPSISNFSTVEGIYSESNGSYRFDVTGLIQNILRSGMPEDQEFFITLPNNGIVNSSLIYTNSDQTPAGKKPQIVITSLKNTNS